MGNWGTIIIKINSWQDPIWTTLVPATRVIGLFLNSRAALQHEITLNQSVIDCTILNGDPLRRPLLSPAKITRPTLIKINIISKKGGAPTEISITDDSHVAD